jgi:hypothetical protein
MTPQQKLGEFKAQFDRKSSFGRLESILRMAHPTHWEGSIKIAKS